MYAKEVLLHAEVQVRMGRKPTYIICGKSGPTGKTWLWNKLRGAGYNAIEISEGINYFVDYNDDQNHMYDMGFNQFLIVLNKPLDNEWKV